VCLGEVGKSKKSQINKVNQSKVNVHK